MPNPLRLPKQLLPSTYLKKDKDKDKDKEKEKEKEGVTRSDTKKDETKRKKSLSDTHTRTHANTEVVLDGPPLKGPPPLLNATLPPHLTVSAIEAKKLKLLKTALLDFDKKLQEHWKLHELNIKHSHTQTESASHTHKVADACIVKCSTEADMHQHTNTTNTEVNTQGLKEKDKDAKKNDAHTEKDTKKHEPKRKDSHGGKEKVAKKSANTLALGDAPLTDFEKLWIDQTCLLRFLRARDLDVNKSYHLLLRNIKFRRKEKPHLVAPEEVHNISAKGNYYRRGFDSMGHPLIYMNAAKETSHEIDEAASLRSLTYLLERTVQSMDRSNGVEKMTVLVNYRGYTTQNQPPLSTALKFLTLLSEHYPERLHQVFIVDTPWYFRTFWSLLSPFVPERTKKKMRFIDTTVEKELKEIQASVPPQYLEKWCGGESEEVYKYTEYWEEEERQYQCVLKQLATLGVFESEREERSSGIVECVSTLPTHLHHTHPHTHTQVNEVHDEAEKPKAHTDANTDEKTSESSQTPIQTVTHTQNEDESLSNSDEVKDYDSDFDKSAEIDLDEAAKNLTEEQIELLRKEAHRLKLSAQEDDDGDEEDPVK